MAPDFELLRTVIDRLKVDATVSGFVGARVFDRVPEKQDGRPNVASPYISIGPTTSIPAGYDCVEAEEITIQIDVWSWGAGEAYGSAEVRKIASAVKRSLHDAEIDLAENALVTLAHELTRILRDPDGFTNHAVVQFTAVVETP